MALMEATHKAEQAKNIEQHIMDIKGAFKEKILIETQELLGNIQALTKLGKCDAEIRALAENVQNTLLNLDSSFKRVLEK